jgi:hypothetical protein
MYLVPRSALADPVHTYHTYIIMSAIDAPQEREGVELCGLCPTLVDAYMQALTITQPVKILISYVRGPPCADQ